jgi:polysaccharide deacetylase family protein (PEP-CTERM system associated)
MTKIVPRKRPVINALSVDLEDWFCVSNMADRISVEAWPKQELRVRESTAQILEVLTRRSTEATFFVLGWIAEQVPDLIEKIRGLGHEIATHGYSHALVTDMTPEAFEKDLERSLQVLKGLGDHDVIGYRAPTFTITTKTLWAADTLVRNGIRYDSSVFPMSFKSDYRYMSGLSTDVFRLREDLLEFPIGCASLFGLRVPFAGGCFFRFLPYAVSKALFRATNGEGRPVMFYIHPWEVDPGQPRVIMPPINKLRHYVNLDKTLGRLDRLLGDVPFTSARKVLGL